ncbi:MAG: repressor LexA [Deltaproteobacteria bacterium RIFCSPLOWO2_02_FULL_44_10]|nr:MAG: repressor LexA [Deltaproteobacteria bacterium RIFCSPHIGHO2_02_FULL_44_16]OGQ46696.1 MAG: repressor LexA [Deltaproteobacteria bacterium RIFCSPLOWO2_02_FULL_44_10]
MTIAPKVVDPYHIDILRRFYRANRRLPSYGEMTRLFGYQSKNAAFRFAQKLITEGYLEKDKSGRLIPKGDRLGIPLAGFVQAGFPSPAEEELIDTLSLDEFLIDKPEASFLLKVNGDSMVDAGILEGDLVIIERGKPARSGDIILAHIDNEWTLKYFQKRGTSVELIPANPKYPVLRPRMELKLGGIVKAVIRKY